jgi:hypothetical protein
MEFTLKNLPLLPGSYFFSAAVYDKKISHPHDHHYKKYMFNVAGNPLSPSGIANIDFEFKAVS